MNPSFQNPDSEPASSLQRALAGLFILLLIGIGVALTPYAATPLIPIPSYMLSFGLAMIITNLLLAGLLFSRGHSGAHAGALYLGAAYFFVFAMFLPLTACFPDAIVKGSLIGGKFSAVWLWSFWHAGFGLLVLRYVWEMRRPDVKETGVMREITLMTVAVVGLAAMGTWGLGMLPPIFASPVGMFEGVGLAPPLLILAIDAAAAIVLVRIRHPNAEQLWLGVGMIAACVDVWLTLRGGSRFTVGWYFSKLASLFTTAVVLVSMFNDLTKLYRRVSMANRVLAAQVHVDGLTGIANRRAFDEAMRKEWARAARGGHPLSLMMIDVDWFKRFNDFYGHMGGDDCLRTLAGAIESRIRRPSDMAARYGGEEFVVILPMTDLNGASVLADRLRIDIEDLAIPHGASDFSIVTLSIGIAECRPGAREPSDRLIEAADSALYRAKGEGRNRVCGAPSADVRQLEAATTRETLVA